MDRHLIAYVLIAALLAALALGIARARYNSRANVLKRHRQADQQRRTQARRKAGEAEGADPEGS